MNTAAAEKTEKIEKTLTDYAITTKKLNLWYGSFQALFDIDLNIRN